MTNKQTEQLTQELNELTETLHQAEKSRTLEEQVAYLKSQGIDPAKNYKKWDDDAKDDEWE